MKWLKYYSVTYSELHSHRIAYCVPNKTHFVLTVDIFTAILLNAQIYIILVSSRRKTKSTSYVSALYATFKVFPHITWRHLGPFTSYRNNRNCSTVVDFFFNKDSTKKCLSSDYIQENIWYFSESKTIEVHCRGAKMYFPIFSDMLFWEACGKNVKYYEL
jgi:hypothetical protein